VAQKRSAVDETAMQSYGGLENFRFDSRRLGEWFYEGDLVPSRMRNKEEDQAYSTAAGYQRIFH
jgi:hypothetical protein